MSGLEIAIAVITGFAVNELCDVSPWIADRLVKLSVWLRYTDPDRAAVRAEELSAYLSDRPGKLFKLGTAMGFLLLAIANYSKRRTIDSIIVTKLANRIHLEADKWAIRIGWEVSHMGLRRVYRNPRFDNPDFLDRRTGDP